MSKELTQNMGQFDELLSIIDSARTRVLKAVNAELIWMYWNVGNPFPVCAPTPVLVTRSSTRW